VRKKEGRGKRRKEKRGRIPNDNTPYPEAGGRERNDRFRMTFYELLTVPLRKDRISPRRDPPHKRGEREGKKRETKRVGAASNSTEFDETPLSCGSADIEEKKGKGGERGEKKRKEKAATFT